MLSAHKHFVCVCVCVRACSRDGTGVGKDTVAVLALVYGSEGKECMLCKHGCVLWMHVICPQALCVCVCVRACVCACVLKGRNWCGERHSGGVGFGLRK